MCALAEALFVIPLYTGVGYWLVPKISLVTSTFGIGENSFCSSCFCESSAVGGKRESEKERELSLLRRLGRVRREGSGICFRRWRDCTRLELLECKPVNFV